MPGATFAEHRGAPREARPLALLGASLAVDGQARAQFVAAFDVAQHTGLRLGADERAYLGFRVRSRALAEHAHPRRHRVDVGSAADPTATAIEATLQRCPAEPNAAETTASAAAKSASGSAMT